MRSRRALTAALALSAVTILTVAACGSSVQGSAQVNSNAAVESTTSAQTTAERTSRTSVAEPTDLSELSSMLNDLPTDIPTDLGDLSDIPIPTDLTGLASGDCLTVQAAYAQLGSAIIFPSDSAEAQDLQQYLEQFGGDVPAELAPDVQALKEVAEEAKGKDFVALGELLSGEKYTTADAHIQAWIDANCG